MSKTYLITGGAGFIGSTLAERLLRDGHKVVVIDNFCDFYDPRIKERNILPYINNDSFRLVRGDIRDVELLDAVFEQYKVDAVVHLAAMAGVRPSIENPLLYQNVNGDGTQNILEHAKKYGVKNLVMASSSSVYGNCKSSLS